jgi:hypothetical protein
MVIRQSDHHSLNTSHREGMPDRDQFEHTTETNH